MKCNEYTVNLECKKNHKSLEKFIMVIMFWIDAAIPVENIFGE